MIIIGLCGGSGAGKGAIAAAFKSYGVPSIDADAVYRDLTVKGSSLLEELSREFGDDIISSDGSLNRKRLSEKVFSEEGRRSLLPKLNRITHSAVIAETERRMEDIRLNGAAAVIFDAPQLFESGFDKKCDTVIAVTASREVRIARIIKRDGISRERAEARINAQLTDEFLAEHADFVIVNNGTEADITAVVSEVAKKINL